MAGVLKPALVTKKNGDGGRSIISYFQKQPPEVFCVRKGVLRNVA